MEIPIIPLEKKYSSIHLSTFVVVGNLLTLSFIASIQHAKFENDGFRRYLWGTSFTSPN